MQPLKQALLKGYTTKETVRAYLVTGWFSFGAFLLYLTLLQPQDKLLLPDVFYLVLISLVMVVTFPVCAVISNGVNGLGALARHDYPHALLSFGLVLGILLAWYIIRYALYGRPRSQTVPAP